ncbi:phosphatidylinositol-4- kinase [Entomophthora muscae]|nr:phosphatidylinositol-4- kinase [Entomophthora muscae]
MSLLSGMSKVLVFVSEDLQVKSVPVFLKILQRAPYLNYQISQNWEEIPPIDNFVCKLTRSLLLLGQKSTLLGESIFSAIWEVFMKIGADLRDHSTEVFCTRYLPAWMGFLRALSTTSHTWKATFLEQLEDKVQALSNSDIIDCVDETVDKLLSSEGNDYAKQFYLRYYGGQITTNRIIAQYLAIVLNFLLRQMDYGQSSAEYKELGVVGCWDYLCTNPAKSLLELTDGQRTTLHSICNLTLEIFASLESNLAETELDAERGLENSQLQLFTLCMKIAALCCITFNEVREQFAMKLDFVLCTIYPKLELSDGIKVANTALDTISVLSLSLAGCHASLSTTCCKFLITPTLDTESLTSDSAIHEMREVASSRLAHSVKLDSGTATSTIHFLVNHLFSLTEKQDSEGEHIKPDRLAIENVISAISHIGQLSHDQEVADLAVTMLYRQFAKSTVSGRAYVLEKLADIVLSVPRASYDEILGIFSAISKAETSADSKTLMSTILKCYYSISYQIASTPERCEPFFKYMLVLANEKGVHIQRSLKEKRKGVQITAVAGELGILLPVLGQILRVKEFEPHLEPDEELRGECRNLWFHCVMYDFVSESTWVKEWRSSMLDIAAKTPLLVPNSSGNYLDTDLEYNSVLRRGFNEQELLKVRNLLNSVLPAHVAEIKYLSFAQLIFLLSLYHIESMRASSGNFAFILNYFANESVASSKIAGLVEAIAEEIFAQQVRASSKNGSNFSLDAVATNQMKQVLVNCCHRVEKMHTMSLRCASRFMEAMPQLMFNRQVLYTALELLQLLWLGCEGEFQDEYCPVFEFSSKLIDVTLQFPDSYDYRKLLLKNFSEAVGRWLYQAKGVAPLELDNHLQAYLQETSTIDTRTSVHYGRSVAMNCGRMLPFPQQRSELDSQLGSHAPDNTSRFAGMLIMKSHFGGSVSESSHLEGLKAKLKRLHVLARENKVPLDEVKAALSEAAAWLVQNKTEVEHELLSYLCWIPVYVFTEETLKLGLSIWSWISIERGDLEARLMNELYFCWAWTITHRKGIFSPKLAIESPFVHRMEYSPTKPELKRANFKLTNNTIAPHAIWIKFFASRLEAFQYSKPLLMDALGRILMTTFKHSTLLTTNPLARESRFHLLHLGLKVLGKASLDPIFETVFRSSLYACAFEWFSTPPRWSSSGNKQLCIDEFKMMLRFKTALDNDGETLNMRLLTPTRSSLVGVSTTSLPLSEAPSNKGHDKLLFDKTRDEIALQFQKSRRLLQLLTDNELSRLKTINDPCPNHTETLSYEPSSSPEKLMTDDSWRSTVRFAWETSPKLALFLNSRFTSTLIESELQTLITRSPLCVVEYSEALNIFLSQRKSSDPLFHKWLLYWAPVPPISAAALLATTANEDPFILQYSMRVLHYFPVESVFFYIPQIVQALRYDSLGYAEKFILDAARVSQLFAHQIIWNMKANFYRNEETQEEDPLKPKLEAIIDRIVNQLSGNDKAFYEREFNFFNKVTGISGSLKPYIKKPKEEKKKKIDEEMKKITVDVGVYLPSNPEGVVVDIDYKSGRPLQSHAKAPFMATFKIRKEVEALPQLNEDEPRPPLFKEVWQAAIFKVGDDCRQDVLALQLIAIFKTIYSNFGLDLYLFPYRIVATAPGCGVIDVIPNSISRDQLGREKVNDLNNYFLATYGGKDSIAYQKARNAYVQSVAAYSVVSYLLQIKDRHNGNIMIDNLGHTIHIDFGFILEISPGGINFESSPFKLTTEMIQVMGGGPNAQPYKWFAELCVKAYLAVR